MGRNRKKNRGLPPRVYIDYGKPRKNGVRPRIKYFLEPPVENGVRQGKRIILGYTEAEMYRNYSQLIEQPKSIKLMRELISGYMQEEAVKKGQETYEQYLIKS